MDRDLGSKWSEFSSRFNKYLAMSSLFLTPPSPWYFWFLACFDGKLASSIASTECLYSLSTSYSPCSCLASLRIYSCYSYSWITSLYMFESNPFQRSRLPSQFNYRFFVMSSGAMFLVENLAPSFRGLYVHYFLLWPIAPQFSHAPLRNVVAW